MQSEKAAEVMQSKKVAEAIQSKETTEIIQNSKVRDSGGKLIFEHPVLCAQFVRDYVDLPFMKDVRPEDIEDVSEQFVTLFEEERNADRVKRIHIPGEESFFIISLIEHKTSIDYNVCMQIFRYMICIWEAYEKEAEERQPGITRRKNFKYPPVLPIVYYEGHDNWTAPLSFKEKIEHGEAFGRFVPDFQYYLVPICKYSNQELLDKADEISLIMLINKLQTQEDVDAFRRISPKQLEAILEDTPKSLVELIAKVLLAFLLKANIPVEEAEELVEKVREKKMAELFENATINLNVDIERRYGQEQRERAERAEAMVEEEKAKAERAEAMVEEVKAKVEKANAANEENLRIFIETYRELGQDEEGIRKILVGKFGLDEESILRML